MFGRDLGIDVFGIGAAGQVIVISGLGLLIDQIFQSDLPQIFVIVFPTAGPCFKTQLRQILSESTLDLFIDKAVFFRNSSVIPAPFEGFSPRNIPVHVAFKVTLAEVGRGTARRTQEKSQGWNIVPKHNIVCRHPVSLRKTACQHAGSGRAAGKSPDKIIFKPCPRIGQSVDMGCRIQRISITAERRNRLLIGHDEQKVLRFEACFPAGTGKTCGSHRARYGRLQKLPPGNRIHESLFKNPSILLVFITSKYRGQSLLVMSYAQE
jgi:hypothetical protein